MQQFTAHACYKLPRSVCSSARNCTIDSALSTHSFVSPVLQPRRHKCEVNYTTLQTSISETKTEPFQSVSSEDKLRQYYKSNTTVGGGGYTFLMTVVNGLWRNLTRWKTFPMILHSNDSQVDTTVSELQTKQLPLLSSPDVLISTVNGHTGG